MLRLLDVCTQDGLPLSGLATSHPMPSSGTFFSPAVCLEAKDSETLRKHLGKEARSLSYFLDEGYHHYTGPGLSEKMSPKLMSL